MKRTARFVFRCVCLAAAVTLVLPLLPWTSGAMVVPAASPYVAMGSAIATRSLGMVALIGLPILVVGLLRRRWFCRHACPMGVLTEHAGRIRRASHRRHVLHRWPPIGTWIVLATLAGACAGYPALLWLDPLAIFTSYFGLCWQPVETVGLWAGLLLPAVLLVSAIWPGAWCHKICPLGATQELAALPRRWFLRARGEAGRPVAASRRTGRRAILTWASSALAAGVGAWAGFRLVRRASASPSDPLRPPGAADPSRFTALCVRCGNCIRVCPASILRPEPAERGLAGFLTPAVHFEKTYCKEDCNRCGEVCPSGAIARFALEEKPRRSLGVAVIDHETCLLNVAECSLCLVCPYGALSTKWDPDTYESRLVLDAAKCPGCGACQIVCRTAPKSIVVKPRPQMDDGDFDVAEAYPLQTDVARAEGWDDPAMDAYDDYDRRKLE